MTRERLFNSIGDKRGYGGSGARKHADKKTDEGAVDEGESAIFQVLHIRKQVFNALWNGKKIGLHIGFEIDKNFGDRKQTYAHDDEIKPVKELGPTKGETRLGRE